MPMRTRSLPLASLRVSITGSRRSWVRTWGDKSACIRSRRSCSRWEQLGDPSKTVKLPNIQAVHPATIMQTMRATDTTTPAGKAMFQMLGVFAEFERAMIAERVRAGLARARSEGKRLGRPPIAPALEKRIREALAAPGRPGVRVIAKQFGVDPGTVQRISRPFDRVGVVVA